jgi:hypothetical protein
MIIKLKAVGGTIGREERQDAGSREITWNQDPFILVGCFLFSVSDSQPAAGNNACEKSRHIPARIMNQNKPKKGCKLPPMNLLDE